MTKRTLFLIISILLINCSDDDTFTDKVTTCIYTREAPNNWSTYIGLNGVSISLPKSISSDYHSNDTLLSPELPGHGISIGLCNLFAIPDINTSCFYEPFHPFDSIPILIPDSIKMSRQITKNVIPLRYRICTDDSTFGALYLRDFISDAPEVYGQLYLDLKKNDFLYFASKINIINDSNYNDRLNEMIEIIRTMRINN